MAASMLKRLIPESDNSLLPGLVLARWREALLPFFIPTGGLSRPTEGFDSVRNGVEGVKHRDQLCDLQDVADALG